MAARGRRRTARPRSRTALALRWIGALVLVGIAAAYVQPLTAYRDARSEVDARSREVARLAGTTERLERRLAEAETDAFVEREARKLGLVRPGERLFIVTGLDERRAERQGRSEPRLR